MKCAIVDAYGAGRLLAAALRRHGIEAVHVRSPHPDIRLAYRPEDFPVDIMHTGDLAATARSLRELGVGAVVAGAESGVLLADELTTALGIAGNGTRDPAARRDKHRMQRAVQETGLATAEHLSSSSVDEVRKWAERRGDWPVVLKPVLSAGTDNVLICASVEELVAAHGKIMASTDRYGRPNRTVLAQEFLHGVEHYVNTVSRNGRHRVIEVWRYHKRVVDGRAIYDYEDLLSLDDADTNQVVDYVRAVLDALEIHNGAGHTEVMLTDDGPVLIECGARLGGGQVPELLTRCVGTDQVDSLALSIADPPRFLSGVEKRYRLLSHLRCVNLINSRITGTVPSGDGWAPVIGLPSFAGLVLALPEGTPLSRTVDMATCPGTVYLSAEDPGMVAADHVRLRELEETGLYG
jgi:biotin carboxylase